MAVYKRSYKAYSGPLTAARDRWLVITRYSLGMAFSSRLSVILFVLALTPILVGAVTIYIANNDSVRALLQMKSDALQIGDRFFVIIMEFQAWLALFVTAWTGPATMTPDLANNALPLFLSRPLSRAAYIAGKVSVLAILLSALTWIPVSLLFLIQCQTSSTPWFASHWYVLTGIFLGSWLWIAVLSLVTLAVSSMVKWRVVATGVSAAILFIPAGFGGVINGVLRTKWGFLFNVPYLMTLIWTDLLHVPLPLQAVPLPTAWAAMVGTALFALFLLTRRIQARQVVRG